MNVVLTIQISSQHTIQVHVIQGHSCK